MTAVATEAVELVPYKKGPIDLRFKSGKFASRKKFFEAFLKDVAANGHRDEKHIDKDHWRFRVRVFEGEEGKGSFVLSLGHASLAALLASNMQGEQIQSESEYFWTYLQKRGVRHGAPRTGLFAIDFDKGEATLKTEYNFIPFERISLTEFYYRW